MVSVIEPPTTVKTKGRILIVDDELVVRDSLGKWFTSEGYTARPASGAREALEIVQQMEFDLALLDIKMPGMDGMELQSRPREADPELTVIIMTGYASVNTAVQALKHGAYDYIIKPVDADELSHLVAHALERASDHDARVLGVTACDLYVPVLSFVFGEAQLAGNCAVVSMARLKEEPCGMPRRDDLLCERLVKGAVHELGHTFGLRHCADWRCVMASSHAVERLGVKGAGFCRTCRKSAFENGYSKG